MKTCQTCQKEFDIPRRPKYCSKACSKKAYNTNIHYRTVGESLRLLKAYGITLEDYYKILKFQGGVCAVCKKSPDGRGKLHVDHNHITGIIRGLLCYSCNAGLGKFKEDPELFRRAVVYLKASSGLLDYYQHYSRDYITKMFLARLE